MDGELRKTGAVGVRQKERPDVGPLKMPPEGYHRISGMGCREVDVTVCDLNFSLDEAELGLRTARLVYYDVATTWDVAVFSALRFYRSPLEMGPLQRASERGNAEGRFGRESQSAGFILIRSCFYMRKVRFMEKKTVFVAFAIEDERQRDFLKGQSLNTKSPFEYIDMSVKEPYATAWKEKVRTRIKRSDGVIALVSKNSLSSSGEKWEIGCAREEGKKVLGIWAYSDDRTNLPGVRTVSWTWSYIEDFIDSL